MYYFPYLQKYITCPQYRNLGDLVQHYGSQPVAYAAMENAFAKEASKYSAAQLTKGIAVKVGQFTITIRGAVVNGIARIGTAFK